MPEPRRIAVALGSDEPYPHHQDVLAGVQQFAREHPTWNWVIDEHPSYGRRGRHGTVPAYDGVIARAAPDLQRRLKQLKIPLVNVWHQYARPGVPGVYVDPAAEGRLFAEHLLERGFRRISIIGDLSFRQADTIICQAVVECVARRGGTCRIHDFRSGSFSDRGYWLALVSYLRNLLDELEPPVGVFVLESPVARLLTTFCEERGWRIAQQVAVACLSNVRDIDKLPPQLTTMDGNFERVGYEAATLLDHLMAGAPVPDESLFIPPKGIIARESTDYFAVEDELVARALRYVSSRLSEELGVETIAAAVAASPRMLQRQFQATLGRPISDEIRRLRLELAKRLLGEDTLRISQIARQTGFKSAESFSHVFQRELGVSPSAYRKQVLGEWADRTAKKR